MRRSPRPRSAGRLAVFCVCTLLCSCAASGTGSRTLDPAVHQASSGPARVSLTAAGYGDDRVELRAQVVNMGTEPLRVDWSAFVLELDELVYPALEPPAAVVLAPGGSSDARLRYDLGRPLLQPARLVAHGLRRERLPLAAPSLEVPARPVLRNQSGTGP